MSKSNLSKEVKSGGGGGSGSKEKKYLFLNDVLYDVTEFERKHPGGSVIRTMLWDEKSSDPLDATNHFREFHYRQNRNPNSQVKKLLNSIPKAPQELQEKARELKNKKPNRDKEMLKDFLKLRQDLEKKGFFEADLNFLFLRLSAIALAWFLGYYVLSFNFTWGIFILSWALQQCGWLHHEGGHRSLTGSTTGDAIIQHFCVSILYSGSANFWNYQHNHHHANTQHEHHDIDVQTLPLIAFDRSILEDEDEEANENKNKNKKQQQQQQGKKEEIIKKKKKSLWIKHQWITFIFTNLMMYTLWRFFIHTRYELRKGRYYYLLSTYGLCLIWHFGILMKFCQYDFFWSCVAYMVYSSIGMWLSLIHFTVSHTFTGVHDGRYNWVETAAYYTVNVKDHWLVNIVMGLLNYQIEHHLFPQMPHINAKRAAPYIRDLFKKYQLPYYQYGYCEGFSLVVKNLYHVGHDLPDVRPVDFTKSKSK